MRACGVCVWHSGDRASDLLIQSCLKTAGVSSVLVLHVPPGVPIRRSGHRWIRLARRVGAGWRCPPGPVEVESATRRAARCYLRHPQHSQDGPITAGATDQASRAGERRRKPPECSGRGLPVRRRDGRGYDLRHMRAAEVWLDGRRLRQRLVPSVGRAGDTGVTDGGTP